MATWTGGTVTKLVAALLYLCVLGQAIQLHKEIEEKVGPFMAPESACKDGECDVSSKKPDVVLLKVCEYEIRDFCLKRSMYDILACLVANKDTQGMSASCRLEIQVQQWVLSSDYKLGPHAHPACKKDVQRFCSNQDRDGNQLKRTRTVTTCLKKNQAQMRLSTNCEAYMTVYMRQGTLQYELDASFTFECHTEIRRHCQYAVPSNPDDGFNGEVSECMKLKFLSHFISDAMCSEQLTTSLQAARTELRTDPLVYAACYRDLRTQCAEVQPGSGRHMTCLLRALDHGVKMELHCQYMLRRRVSMWRSAALVSSKLGPLTGSQCHVSI